MLSNWAAMLSKTGGKAVGKPGGKGAGGKGGGSKGGGGKPVPQHGGLPSGGKRDATPSIKPSVAPAARAPSRPPPTFNM